jgi:hypothetical protein
MKGKISAVEPVCVVIDEENHAEQFETPRCARDRWAPSRKKFLRDGSMTGVVGRDRLRAREQTSDSS